MLATMLGTDSVPAWLRFTEKETKGEREQLGLPPAASDKPMGTNEEGQAQHDDLEHTVLGIT